MVSELCLGTAGFGAQPCAETSDPVLDAFVECGGTFIDTADIYGPEVGGSESALGGWMRRRGHRQALVVATKGGSPTGPNPTDRGLSRRHLLDAVEASLTRLGTDWIDLYQTHWPDPDTPDEETLSALDQMVRQGKVRYVGCSNVSAWRLAHAQGISARSQFISYASVQPHYSLLARSGYERELSEAAVALGVAVLPYRPLARGNPDRPLPGRPDPRAALAQRTGRLRPGPRPRRRSGRRARQDRLQAPPYGCANGLGVAAREARRHRRGRRRFHARAGARSGRRCRLPAVPRTPGASR